MGRSRSIAFQMQGRARAKACRNEWAFGSRNKNKVGVARAWREGECGLRCSQRSRQEPDNSKTLRPEKEGGIFARLTKFSALLFSNNYLEALILMSILAMVTSSYFNVCTLKNYNGNHINSYGIKTVKFPFLFCTKPFTLPRGSFDRYHSRHPNLLKHTHTHTHTRTF